MGKFNRKIKRNNKNVKKNNSGDIQIVINRIYNGLLRNEMNGTKTTKIILPSYLHNAILEHLKEKHKADTEVQNMDKIGELFNIPVEVSETEKLTRFEGVKDDRN